jgi:hypothetical protein
MMSRLETDSRCVRLDAQALRAGAPVGGTSERHGHLGSESGTKRAGIRPVLIWPQLPLRQHRESEQAGV